MELDLTEAIEAGQQAARQRYLERTGLAHTNSSTGVEHYVAVYAEAAVRAAAPIIERAVREAAADVLDEWTAQLHTNYRTGNYDYNGGGIEYINGIEDAAARIDPRLKAVPDA